MPKGMVQSSAKVRPAEEVVGRGVGALDGAPLHGVDHAEGGTSSPPGCTEITNLPPVASDTYFEKASLAPNTVPERLREAGRQAPADLLLGVDDGRGGAGGQNAGHAGAPQEFFDVPRCLLVAWGVIETIDAII